MSYLSILKRAANKYGVHPGWFVVIYVATIPPCIVAGGWFANGLLNRVPWHQLALRLVIAWLFFQAPSIYVMIFGRNLPIWVVTLIIVLMASVGWLNFGLAGVVVVAIFLITLSLFKVWRAKKRLPTIRVDQIDPRVHISEIVRKFKRDYPKPPFVEDRRCPICIPDHEFSMGGTTATRCDVHNCPTVPYWDHARVTRYIQEAMEIPNFHALGAFDQGGHLVGVTWGYYKNVGGYKAFYVDVIILDPDYRIDRRNSHGMLISLIAAFKLRYWPVKPVVIDLLISAVGYPPLGHLYACLVASLPAHLNALATRTHVDSDNVQRVLRIAGYRECETDLRAPDRVYYVMPLRR